MKTGRKIRLQNLHPILEKNMALRAMALLALKPI